MLAALSATWTGGSANLVAVKQIDRSVRQSAAAGAARGCAVLFAVGAVAVVERVVRAALQSLDARRVAAVSGAHCADDGAGRSGRHSACGSESRWSSALGAQRLGDVVAGLDDADHDILDGADRDRRRFDHCAHAARASSRARRRWRAHCWRCSSRCWHRKATSAGMASAPLFILCGLLALAIHIVAARTCGAHVPLRPSAVRHLVAGADRRRRLRARARRDLHADPRAHRRAARHARPDPRHRHRPVHGERTVGTGTMKRLLPSLHVASSVARSVRLGAARAADSCTRSHRRDRRASRSGILDPARRELARRARSPLRSTRRTRS